MKLFLVIMLLFSSGILNAGPSVVSSTPGAGWFSITLPIDGDGKPFPDGSSWDGPNGNFLNFVTGTGLFASDPYSPKIPIGNLQIWGVGAGNTTTDPNFLLDFSGGVTTSTLLGRVAGNSDQNVEKTYLAGSPAVTTALFTGLDGLGTVKSLPSSLIGLILDGPGGTFHSESSMDGSPNTGQQHFVVARSASMANKIFVGIEDLVLGSSDKDYQDLILEIQTVPEPSTWVVGIALISLTYLVRKR